MNHSHVYEAARRAFPGCTVNEQAAGRTPRFAPDPKKPHKKSGYLVLFPDGAGIVGDFRTGYQEYVAPERMPTNAVERQRRLQEACELAEAQRRQTEATWARNAEINDRLWQTAVPIEWDSPPGRYLRMRGVYSPNLFHALRWARKLRYRSDSGEVTYWDALIAAVTNPEGALVSVHRTYLTEFGNKAPVELAKKLMPKSGPMQGASIKLQAPVLRKDAVVIGVAEGIETALAAEVLTGIPTVSATSAHLLAQYVWPDDVQRVFVFGDNDDNRTGQTAAETLATRAKRSGLSARVCIPDNKGEDWADVLEARLTKE